jgi:6-phosphogluconolactonase
LHQEEIRAWSLNFACNPPTAEAEFITLMRPTLLPLNLVLTAAAIFSALSQPVIAADYYAYVGGGGQNFFLSRFDTDTGVLTTPMKGAAAISPTFFTLSADGKFIYTCNESKGNLSAYKIDPATGALTLLNAPVASGGAGTTHISLDKTGGYVAVANYDSGSVAVFALKADGSIGDRTAFDQHQGGSNVVASGQQSVPHAHCVVFDPTNKFLLNCDLGQDKVWIYKFNDKDGTITPNDPAFVATKPGSGPRHLTFSPNGKIVYLTTELQPTVLAYAWDSAQGTLTGRQTIARLPATATSDSITGGEISVDAKGRFLYATNRDVAKPSRGLDSVEVYAIADDGQLTWVQDEPLPAPTFPRFETTDPSGKWLLVAGQNGNTIQVFAIDAATGRLTPQGDPVKVVSPQCITFLAAPAK